MNVTKLPKSHAEFRIAQHLPFLLTQVRHKRTLAPGMGI